MKAGVQWLLRLHGAARARRTAQAYRELLLPEGAMARLILADLATYCRAGQTSFVPGDPHQTAFNEGARDAFLHIAELAGLKPADFPELIHEAQDDR